MGRKKKSNQDKVGGAMIRVSAPVHSYLHQQALRDGQSIRAIVDRMIMSHESVFGRL